MIRKFIEQVMLDQFAEAGGSMYPNPAKFVELAKQWMDLNAELATLEKGRDPSAAEVIGRDVMGLPPDWSIVNHGHKGFMVVTTPWVDANAGDRERAEIIKGHIIDGLLVPLLKPEVV